MDDWSNLKLIGRFEWCSVRPKMKFEKLTNKLLIILHWIIQMETWQRKKLSLKQQPRWSCSGSFSFFPTLLNSPDSEEPKGMGTRRTSKQVQQLGNSTQALSGKTHHLGTSARMDRIERLWAWRGANWRKLWEKKVGKMICLTYVWQPLLMLISVPALIHTVPRFCHSTSSFNSSQRLHQNKTFQPQSSSSFRLKIHRTTVSFEMTHCFWTDSWLKVATFSDSFYGIPWPSSKSSELLTESIPFCFNTLSLPTATITQPKKVSLEVSEKKCFKFGKKRVTTSSSNRL